MVWLRPFIILAGILSFTSIYSAETCPLKNGDIIFIKSQTNQSKFIQTVTGSDWTHVGMIFNNEGTWQVIEAVQPVKWTSFKSFLSRSKNLSFSIKRTDFDVDHVTLKFFAEQFLGKDYDILFQWDDEQWYCSELIWKAYMATANIKLGDLKQMSEFNLDQPGVWSEIEKRHKSQGKNFDKKTFLKTKVITPVDMFNSPLLSEEITESNAEKLSSCFL